RNDPQPANDEATLARRRRISSLPARARCGALISGSCFGRLAAPERRLIASPMLQVLCLSNVRFGSKADIPVVQGDVRFTPKSENQNGSDYIRRGNSGQLSDIRSNPPCLIFTGGGKRRADTS